MKPISIQIFLYLLFFASATAFAGGAHPFSSVSFSIGCQGSLNADLISESSVYKARASAPGYGAYTITSKVRYKPQNINGPRSFNSLKIVESHLNRLTRPAGLLGISVLVNAKEESQGELLSPDLNPEQPDFKFWDRINSLEGWREFVEELQRPDSHPTLLSGFIDYDISPIRRFQFMAFPGNKTFTISGWNQNHQTLSMTVTFDARTQGAPKLKSISVTYESIDEKRSTEVVFKEAPTPQQILDAAIAIP